jgi:hypothetical protein
MTVFWPPGRVRFSMTPARWRACLPKVPFFSGLG